jgi:hypothetical protein
MRIGITGLFLDGQDDARRFHTEAVGFQVAIDTSYGTDSRLLTVASREHEGAVFDDACGNMINLHEPARPTD